MEVNELTQRTIEAAIEVHKHLGPGLLESAYEECLCEELSFGDLRFERQKPLPISYRNIKLDCGYRIDVLVEKILVLELKAIDGILPIHHAQLLTYLRLGGWKIGLLINFNVPFLRSGIKRIVLGL